MGEPTLASVPAPPPEPTTKPGFRTSEFWLKVAAFALTALLASGAIPTNGQLAQVIGMILPMFGSAIYTWSRTSLKNTEGAL